MNAAVFQKLSAAAGRRIVPFSACRPEIHLYVCALSCQIRKMICVTQRRIPLRMSQHRPEPSSGHLSDSMCNQGARRSGIKLKQHISAARQSQKFSFRQHIWYPLRIHNLLSRIYTHTNIMYSCNFLNPAAFSADKICIIVFIEHRIMRRRDYFPDPLAPGFLQHKQSLSFRGSAVVKSRQNMTVHVKNIHFISVPFCIQY